MKPTIRHKHDSLPTYLHAGATWLFTANLGNRLLIDHINALRQAFIKVRHKHPFQIEAAVVLPDHLHGIWTLPTGDDGFSLRWGLIKSQFPELSKTGREYPQALANGVSEVSGKGGFGITLSGMMRIIAHALIISIGIR